MSRPKLPAKAKRKSVGLTLSPEAIKKGFKAARKAGISLSELINRQILKLP